MLIFKSGDFLKIEFATSCATKNTHIFKGIYSSNERKSKHDSSAQDNA
jgi:hypothetical protein